MEDIVNICVLLLHASSWLIGLSRKSALITYRLHPHHNHHVHRKLEWREAESMGTVRVRQLDLDTNH